MNRGSIGRRTSDGSTGAAALEIIASAAKEIIIREVTFTLVAATASAYGLGRPAAAGITPTSPARVLSEGNTDGSTLQALSAIAWGTGPTVPTSFYRRASLSATIGDFITWKFENGLIIPAGGTLVLWNLAANSLADVNIILDERF